MDAGQYQGITYHFSDSAGTSLHITSRTAVFTTLTGTPLSDQIGPYGNDINVPANGSTSWLDNVYLPPYVVTAAQLEAVNSVLLTTTFSGVDPCDRPIPVVATLEIKLATTKVCLPLALKNH
ncbi:MAG TPA: hypothetical protein ENO24_02550 [Chloroflexi bacterium]|nr:hypothetical protein [Chloroflexota bacterium]